MLELREYQKRGVEWILSKKSSAIFAKMGYGKTLMALMAIKALMWDYLDFLQDSAQLLYLRREEGEMYHVCTTLDKLGIEY